MSKIISPYGHFINEADEMMDDPKKFIKSKKKLIKLFLSPKFTELLHKMIKTGDFQIKTVANRILNLAQSDDLLDISYLDIVEGKEDTISFMPAQRAWRAMDFKDQEDANKPPAANSPMWTASARQTVSVGKLIGKLFSDVRADGLMEFSDVAVDKFIRSYKGEIQATQILDRLRLVKGEDIRFWYSEKNYASKEGTLASCMSYENSTKNCQPFFDIYCKNPDKCNMLILTNENNKLIGRALVWIGLRKPTDKTFMDRIYTAKQGGDEEIFKKYAMERGWLYKYAQTAHDASYMENGQRVQKSIAIALIPREYKHYPYMDTMKFYNPSTGRLGSDAGNPVEGMKRFQLQSADGSAARID